MTMQSHSTINSSSASGEEVSLIKDVFRKILEQHLTLEPALLAKLVADEVLTCDESEEVATKETNCGHVAGVRLLFEKLPQSSDSKFLNCLKDGENKSNELLASYILDEEAIPAMSDSHLKFCKAFEKMLPKMVSTLRTDEILDEFAPQFGRSVIEPLEAMQERFGNSKAALHLCFSLLRCPFDWPSTFVRVVEKCSYEESLVEELETILSTSYVTEGLQSVYVSDKSGEQRDFFNTNSESFKDGFAEYKSPGDMHAISINDTDSSFSLNSCQKGLETPTTARDAQAVASNWCPSENTKEQFTSEFHKNLYAFQRKLAEPALQDKINTVLVSPTGTGKTHVAAFIIDQHLNKLEAKQQKGRVVFIVPTIRLAKQQRDKLEDLIGTKTRDIRSVIGDNIEINCSLLSIMNADNVCITVMTAQVLLNGLQEFSAEKKVHLEDISLLVLDECHHAQKEHPYNRIMKLYLQKRLGSEKHDGPLPQIVAMTATLGTGGSTTTEKAMNHIFQLCANLDAHVIQPVPHHDETFLKFLNIPEDIGPITVKPRKKDPFRAVLENVMKKVEEKMESCMDGSDSVGGVPVVPRYQRDTQNYETWIANLKNKCREIRNQLTSEQHQTLMICLENLKVYNTALCMHRDVRPQDAIRYLNHQIEALRDRTGDCYDELVQLFEASQEALTASIADTDANPLLEKIKEMFLSTYLANPESRAILFTRTRPYTKALKEWLKEDKELQNLNLNPGRVIGSQDPEISKSAGDETIRKFRLGEHKVVVSTNVLEEGFDLQACNLVIRHNYVPSETGHTQVKGRGRAKASKSFLVALEETGQNFKEHEMDNKMREKWSTRLLDEISNMTQLAITGRIKEQQTIPQAMWSMEQQQQQVSRGDDPNNFRLVCSKCPQVVCSGADVVCLRDSKYVVKNSRIKEVCQIHRKRKPKFIKSNEFMNGKIYCKKCAHHWGSWITFERVNLPILTIKDLDIKDVRTDKVIPCGQWSKVSNLFRIDTVQTIELPFDIAEASLHCPD
ncbi:ATP-dependent RNA helicase DHX58-like isoform X2 [Apostichopus japonicus]|uniref:ATP-dependent RNA helicase DHX58-like isoform X2 n=2 Tax=Stichopus japonicus TaxID=307972 RepID=UPI003AB7726D